MEIKLRGHHLSSLATYLFTGKLSTEHINWREKYGEEYNKKVKEIYKEIINNPDKITILINSVDSVCKANCLFYKKEKCESVGLSIEDNIEIEEYNLKIGKNLNSTIIQEIKDYKERDGLKFKTYLDKKIYLMMVDS